MSCHTQWFNHFLPICENVHILVLFVSDKSIKKYYLQWVTNVKHNVSSQRNVSGENWISVKSSTWWCPDSLVTLSSCCADLVFALRSYGNPDVTVWRGSWRNVWWEATEYGHQLWETAASNAVLSESNRTSEILRLLVAWMHRSWMLHMMNPLKSLGSIN